MYIYQLGCHSLFFFTRFSLLLNLQPIDQVKQVLINLLRGELQLVALKCGHFLQDLEELLSHANGRLNLQILEIYLDQVALGVFRAAHINSLIIRAGQGFFTTLYDYHAVPHQPNLHDCIIIDFLFNRKLFFRGENSVSPDFINKLRFDGELVAHNFLETLAKIYPVLIVISPDCNKNRVFLIALFNVGIKFNLHFIHHFPDLDIRIVKNGDLLLYIVSQDILPGNISNDPLHIFEAQIARVIVPHWVNSHDLDRLFVTQQLVLADDRVVEFGALMVTPLNYRGLNFVPASGSDHPLLEPKIEDLLHVISGLFFFELGYCLRLHVFIVLQNLTFVDESACNLISQHLKNLSLGRLDNGGILYLHSISDLEFGAFWHDEFMQTNHLPIYKGIGRLEASLSGKFDRGPSQLRHSMLTEAIGFQGVLISRVCFESRFFQIWLRHNELLHAFRFKA